MTQKLPRIYTANHATFPIRIRKITLQICGNFWVTEYVLFNGCALGEPTNPLISNPTKIESSDFVKEGSSNLILKNV